MIFVTFPILVWMLDGALPPARVGTRKPGLIRRLWPAFRIGWMFGFGYFLAGLWWIGNALLVEAETFAWLLPIAVTALPAGLALFWGLACAVARIVWHDVGRLDWLRVIILATALALAEFARGTVLTGFPWNLVGYAAMPSPAAMQSAALIGAYGVTFLTLLAACAPSILPRPGGWKLALPMIAILVGGHIGYGTLRLSQNATELRSDIVIRIVQPAIGQRDKWLGTNEDAIMTRYLDGTNANTGPETASAAAFTHIIWPESAFPFILTERRDRLTQIADLLPATTTLLTGAMRREPSIGNEPSRVYNSILAVDGEGTVVGARDKVHLVPFGEYLPFTGLLAPLGLQQVVAGSGFAAGSRRGTLALADTPPLLPLICYEIIFPGRVMAQEGERPAWIVNLTNDAWYGNTPGPYQHAHQAQVRAVETGLPLVRAANNGISMVTDGYGRRIAELPLGVRGVVDSALPVATGTPPFTRMGNHPVVIFLLGLLLVAMTLSGVVARRKA